MEGRGGAEEGKKQLKVRRRRKKGSDKESKSDK